jgi:hypothetical protein
MEIGGCIPVVTSILRKYVYIRGIGVMKTTNARNVSPYFSEKFVNASSHSTKWWP